MGLFNSILGYDVTEKLHFYTSCRRLPDVNIEEYYGASGLGRHWKEIPEIVYVIAVVFLESTLLNHYSYLMDKNMYQSNILFYCDSGLGCKLECDDDSLDSK